MWTQTFERDLENVFAIQDEIASSVVLSVQTQLLGDAEPLDIESAVEANPDGYLLYLKGRHLLYKRGEDPGQHERARKLFEQAIAIDPDYAPAYAGLATAIVLGPMEPSLMFPMAEDALNRALALDAENSEAFATLGLMRQLQFRQEESRVALQRAIALNPSNAQAHAWLGRSLSVSDPARYLAHVRRAYRTDPLDPTVLFHLARAASKSGHYDEALAAAGELHDLDADSGMGFWLAGDIYHDHGQIDRVLKTYFTAYQTAPDITFMPVPREYITIQDYDLAEAWVLDLKRIAPNAVPIAEPILALLDQRPQQAFELWSDHASRQQSLTVSVDIAWAHLIFAGDFIEARRNYEQYLVGPGESTAQFDASNWVWFVDYALALQRTGEPERAAELVAESMAVVEMQLKSGVVWGPYYNLRLRIWLSALYSMSGNAQRATDELKKAAAQEGVLTCTWCLRYWPHWDNIRDDPVFEALIVEQEESFAAMRKRLRAEGLLLTPAEFRNAEDFSFSPFAL